MLVQTATPTRVADEVLSLAASDNLVIFVGAFVSSRNPSALPMAISLKSAIAEGIWTACRGVLDPLVKFTSLTTLPESRFKEVPLELLAEEVIRKTGLSVTDLLGWLANPVPNTNHRVLATLSDRGLANIATTNFDELVEASSAYPSRIIKLHGSVSRPETMVARLSQVGQGRVCRGFRQLLRQILNHRSVCFIGYAGRDLDILPVLRELNLNRVLWVARPSHSSADEMAIEAELGHLEFLEKTSEHFRCLSTDANSLFDALALRLGVTQVIPGSPFDWESSLKSACQTIHHDTAAIAFARVLGASGLWEQATLSYASVTRLPGKQKEHPGAVLYEAEAHYWLGNYPRAKAMAAAAARMFAARGESLEQAKTSQILGLIASRSTSSYSRAWAPRYMQRVTQLIASCSSEDALVVSTNNFLNLGIWLKNIGQLPKARDVLDKGLRQALRIGDFRAQEKLHHALGIVLRRKRQLLISSTEQSKIARAARMHLGRARELASYLGVTAEEARVLSTRVNLELDGVDHVQGAVSRANRLLNDLELLVDKSREPEQTGRVLEFRAIILAAQGRFADAEARFTDALAMVQTNTAKASCLRGRASARIELGLNKLAIEDLATASGFLPAGPERDQVVALSARYCNT